jgi:predicted nucleotidyltransferase
MNRRTAIAQEASRLLYYGVTVDYKEAKLLAAKSMGVNVLPSNFDIALELDRLADEMEGDERKELIIRLRKEALFIMDILKEFNPRLIGSVWRGTARKGSDIDIQIYSNDFDSAIKKIRENFKVKRLEWVSKTDDGTTERFFHIYLELPSGDEVEVSIKNPEEERTSRRDAIYGDIITGLRLQELIKLLETNPLQKFIPKRRR